MMTLQEIIKQIEALPDDAINELEAYLKARRNKAIDDDEMTQLASAFAAMREGLSDDALDEIVWAMNVEYIEPDSEDNELSS